MTPEERARIHERNMELERKRSTTLAAVRQRDSALWGEGSDPTADGTPGDSLGESNPFKANYAHVNSRLLDQTEAYIQKIKARRDEAAAREAAAAAGSSGSGKKPLVEGGHNAVVPGNFAGQIGVQKRVAAPAQWRAKLYG